MEKKEEVQIKAIVVICEYIYFYREKATRYDC